MQFKTIKSLYFSYDICTLKVCYVEVRCVVLSFLNNIFYKNFSYFFRIMLAIVGNISII